MSVTTENVRALREETGISVMECKKALEEAKGDREKALAILRKRGALVAQRKADRALGAGAVEAYVHGTGEVGTMVLLLSETDFVSKNEEFHRLARDIALHATATAPEYISRSSVSSEILQNLTQEFSGEVAGKPEGIREKIIAGKIDSYLAERTLLEQPFVKNPEITIGGLIENAIQKFGERIEISKCVRFSVRE